jgi:hypothetical protein
MRRVKHDPNKIFIRGIGCKAGALLSTRRSGTLRRAEIFDGQVVRALRATPDQINRLFLGAVSKAFVLPPVETGGYSWATLTAVYMCGLIEYSPHAGFGTEIRAECRIINANRIYSTL